MRATNYNHVHCTICGKHDYAIPLHGDRGGPLCCLLCVGEWHANQGRRRRLGRILYRAMRAYEAGGGTMSDIDKLKVTGVFGTDLDPLGYMADTAKTDGEMIELTSELLANALQLTHPDHHPPERRELAQRVTAQLLALQPFVFPAPKPKPQEPVRSGSDSKEAIFELTASFRRSYPCSECADTIPHYYCQACLAEFDRRTQEQSERRDVSDASCRDCPPHARHAASNWRASARMPGSVLSVADNEDTAIRVTAKGV
jgi:hypothetical protein